MSKFNRLIVLSCIALCGQNLCAQSSLSSLDDLFQLAEENSRSIQSYRTGKEAADEALKAARSLRMPDISVSASASYLGNGKLWDRDFSNGTKISMPHFGNNFALEAQQVVYAGGAISSRIEIAELEQMLAELDWQKNRQEIRFLLVGYYLDLYKLNNQAQVLQHNLSLTDQVIARMKARREQGTVLKNDITRYELQKEDLQLQLTQVQDECKILNHRLTTTLHLPEGTVIVPDSTLATQVVETLTEESWQNRASQQNLDLQQAQTSIELSEQRIKAERSERLPQVSLMAADHLDGPITIEVPVLDNNFNYWYVGVGVTYKLSSLYKNGHKLKQARLNARRARETKQLVEEQVENAVQAGYTHFQVALTELRTKEKSVQLAHENYDLVNRRYEQELALLTDMLDASNTKLSAELDLANARINVIYNYYYLKYLTHTL
ncbi:MAG: TolC family protein [Bacteroidaceae bacterium]|jgi:outer membrane protein